MQYINLTSHSITEVTSGVTIPASGRVARVKQSTVQAREHSGIPIYASKFGEAIGIPEPQEGVIYIVSSLVLNGTSRTDVVSPGNLQRNEHGQPIGCIGFRQNVQE